MAKLQIEGIDIHFEKSGKGKPLIFLHGIFHEIGCYRELIEILGRQYTVYAIDLPMHGKSGNPDKDMSLLDLTGIFSEFVEKVGIRRPIICAHSAGALVGMEYAVGHEVSELVLIDPAGIVPYESSLWLLFKLGVIKPAVSLSIHPIRTARIIRLGFANLVRNWKSKGFWRLFRENCGKDMSGKLGMIECPVVLLWARADELFPYRKAKALETRYPNVRLIRTKGNHDWPSLRPEEILKYINSGD